MFPASAHKIYHLAAPSTFKKAIQSVFLSTHCLAYVYLRIYV